MKPSMRVLVRGLCGHRTCQTRQEARKQAALILAAHGNGHRKAFEMAASYEQSLTPRDGSVLYTSQNARNPERYTRKSW
jgi:hypothetical protein